jgi:hypothetical protein
VPHRCAAIPEPQGKAAVCTLASVGRGRDMATAPSARAQVSSVRTMTDLEPHTLPGTTR